jgi:hypothetical protein
MPNAPVTLTPEQIEAFNAELSTMRHDINNHLTMIVAAAEVIRTNPEMLRRWEKTLVDKPQEIKTQITKFSSYFDKVLGITRESGSLPRVF